MQVCPNHVELNCTCAVGGDVRRRSFWHRAAMNPNILFLMAKAGLFDFHTRSAKVPLHTLRVSVENPKVRYGRNC